MFYYLTKGPSYEMVFINISSLKRNFLSISTIGAGTSRNTLYTVGTWFIHERTLLNFHYNISQYKTIRFQKKETQTIIFLRLT